MKFRGFLTDPAMLLGVTIFVLIFVATVSTVATTTATVTNTTAGFVGQNVTGATNALTLIMPIIYVAIGIIIIAKFLG